jgi:hypothetical protein
VSCLIDSLPSDLTLEHRQQAEDFTRTNSTSFSMSEFNLGRTSLVQHRIDTGDRAPFKEPLRRHPLAYLPVIDEHVDRMLEADVVEPAVSPWASNVVLIRKKNNNLRFFIHYRRLNSITTKDSYPLPRVEDCLRSLGSPQLLRNLDLRSGYWHAEISPEDRDKTSFVTSRGIFRFKVISFGLVNAPALFQRLMDLVLSGMTWNGCLVYLDDIVVHGNTFDEHLERLAAVLRRIAEANLKLNPQKCRLFQRQITFLGHVISAKGIAPDSEKVDAIMSWPKPRNVTEVRFFVGLCSYYRSHMPQFAELAQTLHALTKKHAVFQWTDSQEHAFLKLKESLMNAPLLCAPSDEGRFLLDTDSSDVAVGAVLQQEQDGQLRVIGYASRCLDRAQRNYCTTRKELYGVVFGVRKFRQFLLARQFVLRTDHAALTYLLRTPEPVGQQARWLDLLAEYDPVIEHRAGTAHGNADALSRRPCVSHEGSECSQFSRWATPANDRRVHTRSRTTRVSDVGTPDVSTPSVTVQQIGDEGEQPFDGECAVGQ